MAYGFNEDRSKAPVYTKVEIDAMDLVNDQALAQEVADRQAGDQNSAASISATNARIDNIIASAGDGTIPTELSDLRKNRNGDTYAVAKDSIWETDLHSHDALFNSDSVAIPLEVLNGYYATTDGIFHPDVSTYVSTRKFPVTEFETYSLPNHISGGWFLCYWNEDGGFLSSMMKGSNDKREFTVPQYAHFASIGFGISYTGDMYVGKTVDFNDLIVDMSDKVIDSYTASTDYTVVTEQSKRIASNCVVLPLESPNNDWKLTTISGISNAKYIAIHSRCEVNDYYHMMFCDSAERVIAAYRKKAGPNDFNAIVKIPVGTKKIIVSSYKADPSCSLVASISQVIGIRSFDDDMFDNFTLVWDDPEELTYQETEGFLSYRGDFSAYNNIKLSNPIDVHDCAAIKFSACRYYAGQALSFFGHDGNFITSYDGQSSGVRDYENVVLRVPHNAYYAKISFVNMSSRPEPTLQKLASSTIRNTDLEWNGKKWACVGDSLTEHNIRATKNYHDYIAEETGITVVNMGQSGSGYKKKYDINQAFYQRVSNIPADADVVTIFGSFNDGSYFDSIGDPADSTNETLCGCMNMAIDAVFAINPVVPLGIVAPTPWSAMPRDDTGYGQYVAALEAVCRRRGIPFLDLYHGSGLRPWDSTFRNAAYSRDEGGGVHPDETGHALLAPKFKEFIATLLRIDN